jgi:hypothetical protein
MEQDKNISHSSEDEIDREIR